MEISAATVRPVSLFYSYSRDEEFRSAIETHLSVLRRSGLIAEWHDRMIGAGGDWKGEIDKNLASADIVLLLISADFLASEYCWGVEMAKALQRHERGEARVIPVILRPCRWRSTPLAKLQAVPSDGKPVTDCLSRDNALDDVAAAIERIIEDQQQERILRAAEEANRKAKEERLRAEAEAKRKACEGSPEAQPGRSKHPYLLIVCGLFVGFASGGPIGSLIGVLFGAGIAALSRRGTILTVSVGLAILTVIVLVAIIYNWQ